MIDVAARPLLVPVTKVHARTLPLEVFHLIFSYVEIDDIIKLILSHTPLYYQQIREALAARVLGAKLVATNRVWLASYLESYKKQSSFMDRRKAEYLSEPRNLPVILLAASPRDYVTVSYYVSSLKDIHGFLRLADALPKSFGVRYNVELEFDSGMLHVIDLLTILAGCGELFGHSLKVLMVTNYNGDLNLDMTKFLLLEALWLTNTNVTFSSSFELNLALKRIVIHPNYNGVSDNNPVLIDKSLPPNLVLVHLGQSVVLDSSNNYAFPENIVDVTIMTVRDTLMKYLGKLFEDCLVQRKLLVYESALAECSAHATYNHIQWLIKKENVLTKLALTSIKNLEKTWDFSAKTSLKEFKLSKCDVQSLVLPPGITHLDVSNNNIENISATVFANITPALLALNISDNPIDWRLMPESIVFPPNLKDLRMNNTNIGRRLLSMFFPSLLEYLSLEVNQIELFANFMGFSSRLLELNFTCNLIAKLDCPWVPPGTKTVRLTENFLTGPLELSTDVLGNASCIEQVYLDNNRLLTLSDIRLPNTLRILNLDECSISRLENIQFPSSIEELSINGTNLKSIVNVGFGCNSKLRVLNLAQNRISQKDVLQLRLPQSLVQLNLSGNTITRLHGNEFVHLTRLESLSLSWNSLKQVELQLNGQLQSLDLSYNKILELQLRFLGKKITQLAEVNLSMNDLDHLTPNMIGHGDGTIHSNLLEVDVTGNKVSMEESLKGFPESLICLVEGISGVQDRYGYDVGANVIGNTYCHGKRIDVPSL
ncbi:CIC11C00000005918 [Sungouiella intermedia]|uniref:CIC11C00000005918 n=1 Tax=Sungouiella intermedia TaxID=45354 RepID=A0A1L0DPC2_9ASCO|nr:CIC11C00000005918 [[Candida] intermedia]